MLTLLTRRRFGPLFATQLLGTVNDNLLKGALMARIAFGALAAEQLRAGLLQLATAALVLPFFLFSARAGALADRVDKARLTRLLKGGELLVTVIAAVGFYLDSLPLLFAALFGLGVQSAFFGPVKYAILPQHLEGGELVEGNAWIELGSFAAVLAGSCGGSLVLGLPRGGPWLARALVAVALLGLVASLAIPAAPPAAQRQPARGTLALLRAARRRSTVWRPILDLSVVWAVGAVLLGLLSEVVRDVLDGGETTLALAMGALAAGVGAGSVWVARRCHTHVQPGYIALSGLGVSAGLALFALGTGRGDATLIFVALGWIGVCAGVASVPLYTLLQTESPSHERAQMVAANNLLNAAAIVLASAGVAALRALALSPPAVLGVLALACSVWSAQLLRAHLRDALRLMAGGLARALYRVRTEGLSAIPPEGPALVVANHVAFHDAVLLGGLSPRPLRFVMDHRMYGLPILNRIVRAAGVIPIAPHREDPAVLEAAYEAIDAALAAGEVVAIFPEGGITRDGEVAPFKPGVERILARRPVPVVAVGIGGLWGSFFSRARGHAMSSLPRRFRARLRLRASHALDGAKVDRHTLERAVRTLRGSLS